MSLDVSTLKSETERPKSECTKLITNLMVLEVDEVN